MGMPVTVAMGNAYYVFFVPMVIATRMPMPTVMGMPVTMCTGTSTIGKHASRGTPGGLQGHCVTGAVLTHDAMYTGFYF